MDQHKLTVATTKISVQPPQNPVSTYPNSLSVNSQMFLSPLSMKSQNINNNGVTSPLLIPNNSNFFPPTSQNNLKQQPQIQVQSVINKQALHLFQREKQVSKQSNRRNSRQILNHSNNRSSQAIDTKFGNGAAQPMRNKNYATQMEGFLNMNQIGNISERYRTTSRQSGRSLNNSQRSQRKIKFMNVEASPGLQSKNRQMKRHKSTHLLASSSTQLTQEQIDQLDNDMRILEAMDQTQESNEETQNLIHAIKLRKNRMRHSDFYTLLDQVNDRIHMYKSLFLDKRPKFMKDIQGQRINSQEIHERKLKAQEDDKKQKMIAQINQQKKKKQFYENLSKKPGKKFKININERKKAIIYNDQYFSSLNGAPSTGNYSTYQGGLNGNFSQQAQTMTSADIDQLKSNYMKDIARREKLYAQKSKQSPRNKNSNFIGITDQHNRNQSHESISLSKQASFEAGIMNQTSNLQQNTTAQDFNLQLNIRNDITYLSHLKNSASLPYLKHIQIQDQERNPLKAYIEQKIQTLNDTQQNVLTIQDQKKLLKKMKRQQQSLNRDLQTQIINQDQHEIDIQNQQPIAQDLKKLMKEQKKRMRLLKMGEQKFNKYNQKSSIRNMFENQGGILTSRGAPYQSNMFQSPLLNNLKQQEIHRNTQNLSLNRSQEQRSHHSQENNSKGKLYRVKVSQKQFLPLITSNQSVNIKGFSTVRSLPQIKQLIKTQKNNENHTQYEQQIQMNKTLGTLFKNLKPRTDIQGNIYLYVFIYIQSN
eukprot:403337475